jgi:hypothetical protein
LDSNYDDDETWDSKQLPMKMNCDENRLSYNSKQTIVHDLMQDIH